MKKLYMLFFLLAGCGILTTPLQAKKKRKIKIMTFHPDTLLRALNATTQRIGIPISDPLRVVPRFNNKFSMRKTGIDVSKYQGTIDWDKVANDNQVGFAYIKATEGQSLVDNQYFRNVEECKRLKIPFGAYHFFSTKVSPEDQLNNFLSNVRLSEHDLIPIVDVEIKGRRTSDELRDALAVFCEQLTKVCGIRPIIYTSYNFYHTYLMGGRFDQYKIMIARYHPDEPMLKDGRQHVLWQFTSSGRVDGINGRVDISKYGDGFSLKDLMMKK